MCGCELHFGGRGPCACSCLSHAGHREEDRRDAVLSAEQRLAAVTAECEERIANLRAEVARLKGGAS